MTSILFLSLLMTGPHLWKPPPGGKCSAFFHHAFYSSCEALGNSVFNCYRALWAGTDRYGVPAFRNFSLFLQCTRTFYSILGLFTAYWDYLQRTGTSHESVVPGRVQFHSAICDRRQWLNYIIQCALVRAAHLSLTRHYLLKRSFESSVPQKP